MHMKYESLNQTVMLKVKISKDEIMQKIYFLEVQVSLFILFVLID